MPFSLPDDLPPLRLLLVWDNRTGHKTPELVLWLCAHGVMPLYTPVGGSWLRRARLGIGPLLTEGRTRMRCLECGSEAVTERSERTAQGYRRFRCRACGK